MHWHDNHCRWCNIETAVLYRDGVIEWWVHKDHACPQKPPLTPEEGAAVAFGIIGMGEAIKELADSRCGWCRGWRQHTDACVMLSCLRRCGRSKLWPSAFCSADCEDKFRRGFTLA